MGEAPVFVGDELERKFENGCLLKSEGYETATVSIGDRLYLIGGGDNDDSSSLGVRMYDKKTGNWINHIVLGTKPKLCKGLSVIPLDEARILVLKKGVDPDDSVSFLEVDTQYVKDQSKVVGMKVVAWSKGVRGNADKPIVISGPSGVGKGTLISKLMNEYPTMFGFSVSHTTRAPRNMETDGVHYHFTDRNTMEKEIKDGKFLEYASVHGNLYGTSIEAVEVVADSGKRCILDIDVQGARSVKASPLEATFIFISPPSIEELEKRLRARGTESEEQVLKRLRNAQAEIEQGKSSGIFNDMLYNDNLEECYKNLKRTLGLDETSVATQRSPCIGINLPENFSASEHDNKIILNTGMPGLDKSSKYLIVLDVSSLEGGAPGRTRGLDVNAVDSVSDRLGGITQMS